MQGWELVFLIPIVAIVMGIGSEMWKNFLRHQERKLEIKAGSQKTADGSVLKQIDALREEVARLRDTSTQYDISIQHTLEDLQHRLATLESSRRTSQTISDVDRSDQATVGNRAG